MKRELRENFQPESFYQGFSEPEGYGAFDQDHEDDLRDEANIILQEEFEEENEVHPLFNKILAIVRPPEPKKREQVKKVKI